MKYSTDIKQYSNKQYANKLLSIIIPVYNTEKYFERCVNSVLNQSFQNVEIIVVNDGSTGNIRSLIEQYKKADDRIRFVDSRTNNGLFKARVLGAKEATGNYIAFLDSDDYVSYDYYRSLVQRAFETDADIAIGKTVWEQPDGYRFVYNLHESGFQFNCIQDDEIKKAFFGQEASCYSWHTIWNKLYDMNLWKKCEPFFQAIGDHILMTEDILFSSVLFFNARRVVTTKNDAYFYCINDSASTSVNNMTAKRFSKNISDMTKVFNYVEAYLVKNEADEELLNHLKNSRMHYAKMWKHFYIYDFSDIEKRKIEESTTDFWGELSDLDEPSFYFESIQTEWNGGLEYIKEQIANVNIPVVSFDIFDTLITRNLYDPDDIYKLLDCKYRNLTGSSTGFSTLRLEAERNARSIAFSKHNQKEDVTLHEIYSCVEDKYGIDKSVLDEIETYERELELNLCFPRTSGKELFDLSVYLNKTVYLVSDMYLEKDFISTLLKNNGYDGYEALIVSSDSRKLKSTGGLYKVLIDVAEVMPSGILHIGDNWNSDIIPAQQAGINTVFLPKAREVFENLIQGSCTNRCSTIGYDLIEGLVDIEQMEKNIILRIMRALVFNRYFDNPYRSFNRESDFNIDPYLIGYYAVGMHLAGICRWISSYCKHNNVETVHFCARDGALIMEACKRMSKIDKNLRINYNYIHASRKALLPSIVNTKQDFYQIPVEYRGQTPASILKLVDFSCTEVTDDMINAMEKELHQRSDEKFSSREQYDCFITYFVNHLYEEKKHIEAKTIANEYYSQIGFKDVVFDMGYSGRILEGISMCCKRPINGLYIHENYTTSSEISHSEGIDIWDFYDFKPRVSGLLREELLSEINGGCVGFEIINDIPKAIVEEDNRPFQDIYPIKAIQDGALQFIDDFVEEMSKNKASAGFSSFMVSIPFEGFLRQSSYQDRKVFGASSFEDDVYGGANSINVSDFINEQLQMINDNSKYTTIKIERDTFMEIIHKSNKLKRAALYILVDRQMFKHKFRKNIKALISNNK